MILGVIVVVAVGVRVAVCVGLGVYVTVLVGIVTEAGISVAVWTLVGTEVAVIGSISVDVDVVIEEGNSTVFPTPKPKKTTKPTVINKTRISRRSIPFFILQLISDYLVVTNENWFSL